MEKPPNGGGMSYKWGVFFIIFAIIGCVSTPDLKEDVVDVNCRDALNAYTSQYSNFFVYGDGDTCPSDAYCVSSAPEDCAVLELLTALFSYDKELETLAVEAYKEARYMGYEPHDAVMIIMQVAMITPNEDIWENFMRGIYPDWEPEKKPVDKNNGI